MSGHGHVIPNQDGSVARCGGPMICAECAREAQKQAMLGRVLTSPAGVKHCTHRPGFWGMLDTKNQCRRCIECNKILEVEPIPLPKKPEVRVEQEDDGEIT